MTEMASSAYRPVQFISFVQRWQDLRNTAGNKAVGLGQSPEDAHLQCLRISEDKNCDFPVQFWVFTGRCFCWKLPAGNLSWCVPVDALGQRSCDQERSWHRAILWLCVQGQEGARRRLLVGGGLLPPAVLGAVSKFITRQAQVLWRRAHRNRPPALRRGGRADSSPQEGSLARSWRRWPGGRGAEGAPHVPRKRPRLSPQEEGPPPTWPHSSLASGLVACLLGLCLS